MPRYIPHHTDRKQLFAALERFEQVDVVIIGGGATGLGIALDAALRGCSVVLLEAQDFAQGTSSRATKLFHGGVRYLAQGNISLVREALHERSTLLGIAPHLAHALPFVMPAYKCWEIPFYGTGLKAYDLLTGSKSLGRTQFLSPSRTQIALPNLNTARLKGGVMYWDAQFDDARFALALARTASAHSALLINHCPVSSFIVEDKRVVGVRCTDAETQQSYQLRARCVINATGVWADNMRKMLPSVQSNAAFQPLTRPSQGVHVVVDHDFLGADQAMLVPKTQDDRVLFAVPWLGKVILGTTDTKRSDTPLEPQAFKHEVDLILNEASKYLAQAPTYDDIRSIWVGLRPLVQPQQSTAAHTKQLSREHVIKVDSEGLVTVTGGKWTTYRTMAEDVLTHCQQHRLLPTGLPRSKTVRTPLIGASVDLAPRFLTQPADLSQYGTEADWVRSMAGNENEILPGFTEAMVRFAVRFEYARTVEDVLARRSRWLFLDAQSAAQAAPKVAEIMLDEGVRDPQLASFLEKAEQYYGVGLIH
ncbi:MAG TPA: glycerol-3-phosphate dehydrogenase/oxidase [Paenalcaligenes sp.]|nr:glycerol-3-phosphate dehydrogenase/oxidase [Paenalcaligenes sp.]